MLNSVRLIKKPNQIPKSTVKIWNILKLHTCFIETYFVLLLSFYKFIRHIKNSCFCSSSLLRPVFFGGLFIFHRILLTGENYCWIENQLVVDIIITHFDFFFKRICIKKRMLSYSSEFIRQQIFSNYFFHCFFQYFSWYKDWTILKIWDFILFFIISFIYLWIFWTIINVTAFLAKHIQRSLWN